MNVDINRNDSESPEKRVPLMSWFSSKFNVYLQTYHTVDQENVFFIVQENENIIQSLEDEIIRVETTNAKTTAAILKLQSKMASHAVPSIEQLMELKLTLEREKTTTKTTERKLNLKRLAERNQKIRQVHFVSSKIY